MYEAESCAKLALWDKIQDTLNNEVTQLIWKPTCDTSYVSDMHKVSETDLAYGQVVKAFGATSQKLHVPDSPPAPCLLDPEPGICEAYVPSYFYNATSGQCEFFVYGGCGGNENRFPNRLECLRACDPDSK